MGKGYGGKAFLAPKGVVSLNKNRGSFGPVVLGGERTQGHFAGTFNIVEPWHSRVARLRLFDLALQFRELLREPSNRCRHPAPSSESPSTYPTTCCCRPPGQWSGSGLGPSWPVRAAKSRSHFARAATSSQGQEGPGRGGYRGSRARRRAEGRPPVKWTARPALWSRRAGSRLLVELKDSLGCRHGVAS